MGIGKTQEQKRRQFRQTFQRVTAFGLVGALIVGALYLYDYATTSERFTITTVDFAGLTRVEADEIQDMLTDLEGQNILLAPLDTYEARIATHPRVRSARIRRASPHRVVCTVEERVPVALVFTDRFLEVDRDGVVMDEDEYTSLLDLPIITGLETDGVTPGRKGTSPGLMEALRALEICRELGDTFAADISELRVSPGGVTIRSLSDDRVIVLGGSEHEKRLKKYFALRNEIARRDGEARIIDLRFDNQVVVRGSM